MIDNSSISIIILTYNEEKHINRCIGETIDIAKNIFIVDSYSTDKTCELAEALGAKVYQNRWVNYAAQFNWALRNLPIETDWVLRLDADEILIDPLKKMLVESIKTLPKTTSGIYFERRVRFMGRWIRHGGTYPMDVLRLFRFGKGHCEHRWMDEHIKITSGTTTKIDGYIIDDNRNNLGWWTNKHNDYALREAIDMLDIKHDLIQEDGIAPRLIGSQAQRKRWLKVKYAALPLFIRPFIYFIYRYFIKLGFLDGRQGLIWHFLQGFWYRFLVDAKIFEIYSKGGKDSESIKEVIEAEYGIDLSEMKTIGLLESN